MHLPTDARGQRLDRALSALLSTPDAPVSVREVRAALKRGALLLDGRVRAPGDRARGGEAVDTSAFVARSVAVVPPDPELLAQVPVLFEDPHLLVLDKPSGVPTQPLRPGEGGTLLGAAVARAPAIAAAGPPLEGGLVHRLDVGTSGVVVFAKNAAQRMHLRDDFNHHRIEKRYLALARGTLPDAAVAEGPIGPGGPDRVRVGPGGQPARTEVEVLARFEDGLLWVEARTSTGRRHQVRAHLADLGAPIVGDPVYGAGPEPLLARLGLHAAAVTLADGRRFEAPVRGALAEVLDGLRKRA